MTQGVQRIPTCNNDATGLSNAILLKSVEPHGIPNEAKQNRHHDEAPQPAHVLLYLRQAKFTLGAPSLPLQHMRSKHDHR